MMIGMGITYLLQRVLAITRSLYLVILYFRVYFLRVERTHEHLDYLNRMKLIAAQIRVQI